ncbi:hypothetical protein G6F54_014379 [Rhizopus delemar]|nr:hypothetical protein G6F54_014379 [Rhizopus delemar]
MAPGAAAMAPTRMRASMWMARCSVRSSATAWKALAWLPSATTVAPGRARWKPATRSVWAAPATAASIWSRSCRWATAAGTATATPKPMARWWAPRMPTACSGAWACACLA